MQDLIKFHRVQTDIYMTPFTSHDSCTFPQRRWKCKTWKWRTNLQSVKMQDIKCRHVHFPCCWKCRI